MQLICAFVFAYAKSRFSHDMSHFMFSVPASSDLMIFKRYVNCHETYFFKQKKQTFALIKNTGFIETSVINKASESD